MRVNDELFAEDFKTEPYWWKSLPVVQSVKPVELPTEADVVVVGSGYTGLNAGLQTARENLSTLILDAEEIGWGCSSRNGGQVSAELKPSFKKLCKRFGEKLALEIFSEGRASMNYMHELVRCEELNCDFREVGRFNGAYRRSHYEYLARQCKESGPQSESGAYMVPKSEMHSELGTDAYHGGIVYPKHCCIDVGKYIRSLASCVQNAGAVLQGNCRVLEINRTESGFLIETSAGRVKAGKVVLATNGYTTGLSEWHQRRIIPIGSYIIATEPIKKEVMDRIMPTDRVLSDTRQVIYYFRPSPDRSCILFGGRVSLNETDTLKSAVKLRKELVRLFPELRNVRISRSWMGTVGFTFDKLMRTGHENGLYYSMGYCGSGVALSSYLGMRIGRMAAGLDKKGPAFDSVGSPSMPFYRGYPWFLAPSVFLYRLYDEYGFGRWLKI